MRYPLAALVKSPLLLLPLAGAAVLLAQDVSNPEPLTLAELGSALGFAALETLVVGRIFLVGLLEERNFAPTRVEDSRPPGVADSPSIRGRVQSWSWVVQVGLRIVKAWIIARY